MKRYRSSYRDRLARRLTTILAILMILAAILMGWAIYKAFLPKPEPIPRPPKPDKVAYYVAVVVKGGCYDL